MTTTTYRFDQFGGPLDLAHPVLECEAECTDGTFEQQLPAGIADEEPRYTVEECELCDGEGHFDELECHYCGAMMIAREGVGAVVEQEKTRDGRKLRTWYGLCGPCAWAEMLDDGEGWTS